MASKAVLEQKKLVVSEIADRVKKANSVILFDYLGLTVEEVTELRKKLRDSSSDLKVYKNTLTKRAMDELNLNIDEFLTGPSAMVFSEDVVSPAKILTEFSKDHEALKIKTGIVEGEVSTLDIISKLASIPSREGLLTMLAGGMIQYIKDLSISLDLLSKQMEEANPSEAVSEVKEVGVPAEEVVEKTEEVVEKTEEVVEKTVEAEENKEEDKEEK